MPHQATFHRTTRPAPMPSGRILVAPSAAETFDGSGRPGQLCVRSTRHGRRMVPLGDPEALAAAVGDMVVPESTAVWLGGRSRLTLALGAPPTRIERTLRQIAAVHGLEMHGFAGPSEGGLHDLDAYDEVRDGGSVSTRPPRSRG